MLIMVCLRWWYGEGWQWLLRGVIIDRVSNTMQRFSVKDLARTLFAPYRQTFSGQVHGSLDAHLRGAVDNFISRCIGFLVRSFLLLIGIGWCLIVFIGGTATMATWAFIPFLPIIGTILCISGVVL